MVYVDSVPFPSNDAVLGSFSIVTSTLYTLNFALYASFTSTMRKSAGVLVFMSLCFVFSLDPFTFYIHGSCLNRTGNILPEGMIGAKKMATSALAMLRTPNTGYHEMVFRVIFKSTQQEEAGQAVRDRLEAIFTALADMRRVWSPSDEPRGNYRYYCDNDVRDGSSSRWRLLPDPPPSSRPRGYIPNTQRPRWPKEKAGQYQEWWDPVNKVMMGGTLTCDGLPWNVLAVTYDRTPIWAKYPGYPRELIWNTVTFCDKGLESYLLASLEGIEPNFPFQVLNDPMTQLSTVTSGNVIHEFCHFPPWKLEDIKSPNHNATAKRYRAYQWEDVLDIASTWDSLNNVNNVAMYAILARMEELGWRLSPEIHEMRKGRLVRFGR